MALLKFELLGNERLALNQSMTSQRLDQAATLPWRRRVQ